MDIADTDPLRIDKGTNYQGLLQKWRRSTTTKTPATTISPGSLADLNIRMAALQEQINRLSDAIVLEEAQIGELSIRLKSLDSLVTAIFNAVIGSSTG